MLLTKLKIASAVLVAITVVGVGAGSLIYQTQGAEDSKEKGNAARRDQPKLLGQEARDRSADAARNSPSLSSDDLRGKWTGTQNDIKVELTFYGQQARWPAHWQVEFKKPRKPENPLGSSNIGVNKGADLKCAADPDEAGRLNLYLPAYLGDDKKIKESARGGGKPVGQVQKVDADTIQIRIIPTGYENPAQQDYDFPAVEGMILHRVVEEESKVNLKASAPAGEDITVEATPPVVVKTVPQAGLTNVDAKTTEIQVTFSKQMMDESWSWSQLSDDTFPKISGKPKYLKDKRTCAVTVKLEPDKTYAIWLNSDKFGNFKDADGRSAVPYLLVFKTAK
jgi:RNA polymerase sigma-70 factor (ECF subfamily)